MDVLLLPTSVHEQAFACLLEELATAGDEDTIVRVVGKIRHVAAYGGHPDGQYAKRIQGSVDLCEVRSKYHHQKLIRIYYYADKEQSRMLLLNYIIKPDGSNSSSRYEGTAGKKVAKEIKESIDLAVILQVQYPPTHPVYEPLGF